MRFGRRHFRQLHKVRLRGQHRSGSRRRAAKIDFSGFAPAVVHDTPATPTIATLVDLFNSRQDLKRGDRAWHAGDTLKNVVVNLRHPDDRIEPLAVGVPGDRDVDLKRLEAQVAPAEIVDFTEDDFAKNKNLVKGYIGPTALGEKKFDGHSILARSQHSHRQRMDNRRQCAG